MRFVWRKLKKIKEEEEEEEGSQLFYETEKWIKTYQEDSVYNISQPDTLLPQGHLVMFQRATLQGPTGSEHKLD